MNTHSRNPFPGLRPFDADESDLYFGRDVEISGLLDRLQRTRFVAVLGEGGSGKSSLIRAGLVPALEGGFLSGASAWRMVFARPGGDPLASLADALTNAKRSGADPAGATIGADFIEATLRRGSLGLVELVRELRLAGDEKLLLFVDQFEELFRYARERREEWRDRASAFVKLLLNAAESHESSIYVVVTMCADYLGACVEFNQ